jgi:nicotinamidase-related amidase
MKSALLIIDVQQALCSGEWAAFDIDRVVDRINLISAKARAAGAPVILIQHEEDEGPLQFDSAGWQLYDRLATSEDDARVRKTATDSFHETELDDLLQEEGVDQLVVCGLQSDFCVDTTIRRALGLGYPVTLVSDAHSTLDNGVLTAAQIVAHHNTTLANITSFGPRATLTPAAEVAFETAPPKAANDADADEDEDRDYEAFPDDENGDILWNMALSGDNLDIPREVDFSVIFPTEEAAIKFALHLLRNDQKVSFASYEEHDELPWQVQAHPVMEPTHENISGYEAELARDATPLGGRNDGWGCFAQD